jgi:GTP-binding protein
MEVKTAVFIKSTVEFDKLPEGNLPEFAFIGRSNVGKSSLINLLCGNKKLAKTSGTPGKTQTINHFLIDDHWYLVDLPGYGFAKSSRVERSKWKVFIEDYILKREQLLCLFVLIDSRLEPQKADMDFMEFLGNNGVPFVMVFTKTDKQSPNKTAASIAHYCREMRKSWDLLPDMFRTSAVEKKGREELLKFIGQIMATPVEGAAR